MEEEDVVATDVVAHLTGGLEERLRLDVTDGATDLRDDDVGPVSLEVRSAHGEDPALDLVRDVRDDLDGVAEVFAAPLLGDDRRIHLAGGHIRLTGQVAVEEALVVTDVEVGLGAVLGDEHLTVLEGVHRARIDVEIRIQFLHGHAHSPRGEQLPEARGCEALAE